MNLLYINLGKLDVGLIVLVLSSFCRFSCFNFVIVHDVNVLLYVMLNVCC